MPTGAEGVTPNAPIVVVARKEQLPGACLRVAGLTVLQRACKQLLHQNRHVILATAADFPLDAPVPSGVERRQVDGPEALAALLTSLQNPPVVDADVVRPSNKDLSGGVRVTDPRSRLAAEDAIFAELLRGDLGFVARYLNKPISFRITRHLLCRLPWTPNHVTLGAAAIGLLGCALVATGQYGWATLGFLLAHLQSVLDGCDGELARVRFQQSAIGAWLDTIIDDGMNVALVASVGLGLWKSQGRALYAILAASACAMLLTYNAVSYRELRRQRAGGEVLKIRWWFTRGRDLKGIFAGESKGRFNFLMAAGRRDFFVLAWFVLAALNLGKLVLGYALVVAGLSFAVAMGQLLWIRRGTSRTG